MNIDREFLLGCIVLGIAVLMLIHFLPNKFEEKDCTKEELLKLKTIK